MKYLNKLATLLFSASFGVLAMTSCEGGELYDVASPDWLQEKIDSIEANKPSSTEEIDGLMEDVYTIGAVDYSTGWWAQFSKYYVVPKDQKWYAQFNLNINPAASNTYKNFALIITNDVDRGGVGYAEYGAIRFDNQPSGNSEWGDYIDRSCVESSLTFGTDTDPGVDKLGGLVTLSIDRTDANQFIVKMTNGTVTKTYTQKSALVNLNADPANENIRAFLVPEGSYIGFLKTTIEPIGGCTSAEDKQPLSMTLNNTPKKVMAGTDFQEIVKNITATVQFETGVAKDASNAELSFVPVGDFNTVGEKSIVAIFNKTYKGENCASPVTATFKVQVVDKMYTSLGATDNSTAWWGAHSADIQVAPGETFVSQFTNYSCGANNWNNFCVVMSRADMSECAVVRADNYGWGDGYAACIHDGNQGDWGTWLAAMDGAKVTTYVTNNGDGTADIKAVMVGNNGQTYTQEYNGINTFAANDNIYFRFTVDNCHLEFDNVVGNEDNSTGWWTAHSDLYVVKPGQKTTTTFINHTNGATNWNNFCVVLNNADMSAEYGVVRADNYGWGSAYDNNSNLVLSGGQADWGEWLAAMDDARVTVTVSNNGDGSADVYAKMLGNNGKLYEQSYKGLNLGGSTDLAFRLTIEGGHIIFDSSNGADKSFAKRYSRLK